MSENNDKSSVTSLVTKKTVVAITGATSFLGANLVGMLEDDPRVARIVAIDVHAASTAGKKTRSYDVDFTQPTVDARLTEIFDAEQVTALAHLAFVSSPTIEATWEHELESVGTMHVLAAARQAHVRRVVMASSTLLYGAHPSNPNFLSEKHPLRAPKDEPFFSNKIEAEIEANKFAARVPGTAVTILRLAPILGPTVKNFITRYLAKRLVPTIMGFDPLVQFIHEVDAIGAFKHALFRDAPGTFNIVADGVLPLSTVVKLAGRIALPIPHPLAGPMTTLAWLLRAVSAPPSFLSYLRFLSIADGSKAKKLLGFQPAYTTREAVLDFTSAQRLRDVRLLSEAQS